MTNDKGIPQKNENGQYDFADVVFADVYMSPEAKICILESADNPEEHKERVDYLKEQIKLAKSHEQEIF